MARVNEYVNLTTVVNADRILAYTSDTNRAPRGVFSIPLASLKTFINAGIVTPATATVLFGSGVPNNSNGRNGNLYLNRDDSSLYIKDGASWVKTAGGGVAFIPTQANLYNPVRSILRAGNNINITPSHTDQTLTLSSTASGGSGGDSHSSRAIIAYDALPTDLSGLPDNSVIRVGSPATGSFYEVEDKTAFGHGVKIVRGSSGVNRGASLTGTSKYGGIQTEEGVAFTLTDTPIGRIEEESDDDNLVVYIRKSALSATDQAREVIYERAYSGPPSSSNEVDTNALVKQADVTSDDIVWQVYFSGTAGPPARAFDGAWPDNAQNLYWRFFVSPPPGDQNSETLDFQKERDLELITSGLTSAEIRGLINSSVEDNVLTVSYTHLRAPRD